MGTTGNNPLAPNGVVFHDRVGGRSRSGRVRREDFVGLSYCWHSADGVARLLCRRRELPALDLEVFVFIARLRELRQDLIEPGHHPGSRSRHVPTRRCYRSRPSRLPGVVPRVTKGTVTLISSHTFRTTGS